MNRDGEVPQMTTSPRVWEDLAPGTGPQYRSLLCLSRKNRTSSPLQVLNFRGLVWTAGTVLPVLPIPEGESGGREPGADEKSKVW